MDEANGQDEVLVEHVEVPAWLHQLLLERADRAEVLILPRATRDGGGEYQAADISAVKALRAAGVSVDWVHRESERTFRSEYGADLPAAIGLFIAQSLGEHSVIEVTRYLLMRMRRLLGDRPRGVAAPTFTINVDRLVRDGNRVEIEGLRVTGTNDQVIDSVASLLRGAPPEHDN